MGSFFSSPLSYLAGSSIFPAPKCSYTWEYPNLITISKSDSSSCFKEQNIPAFYFGNLPEKNNEPSNEIYIIYSHGNGEDIGNCYQWLNYLHKELKVNILGYEYQGYGLYKGTSSENNCYSDIQNAFYFLRSRGVADENIILYGRSLGTGPTVELASRWINLKGVVLESPYTSVLGVVSETLADTSYCVDPFRNNSKIHLIKSPILILHGTDDEIIPYEHAQKLQNRSKCNLITLNGGGHNNLQHDYKNVIIKTIKTLL
jgi:abhydrolase domain-containing protein 17